MTLQVFPIPHREVRPPAPSSHALFVAGSGRSTIGADHPRQSPRQQHTPARESTKSRPGQRPSNGESLEQLPLTLISPLIQLHSHMPIANPAGPNRHLNEDQHRIRQVAGPVNRGDTCSTAQRWPTAQVPRSAHVIPFREPRDVCDVMYQGHKYDSSSAPSSPASDPSKQRKERICTPVTLDVESPKLLRRAQAPPSYPQFW